MAKIFLFTFFFISFKATLFSQGTSDSVRINIAILDTAKANIISVVIEITNLSDETKKILKHGRVSYINKKIKPSGNYIIEVERLEKKAMYIPFAPMAGTDTISGNKYWEIKPGALFMNTIQLNGQNWNRKRFPEGQYRMRIAFNWNERSRSLKNISKWIMFLVK